MSLLPYKEFHVTSGQDDSTGKRGTSISHHIKVTIKLLNNHHSDPPEISCIEVPQLVN